DSSHRFAHATVTDVTMLVSVHQSTSSRQAPSFLLALLLISSFILHPSSLNAQDEPPPRLMDQVPFDILTLDKANDSKVYKVFPVRLPGRRVPEKPRPTEKLRVKLLDDEQEYDVAWANIA